MTFCIMHQNGKEVLAGNGRYWVQIEEIYQENSARFLMMGDHANRLKNRFILSQSVVSPWGPPFSSLDSYSVIEEIMKYAVLVNLEDGNVFYDFSDEAETFLLEQKIDLMDFRFDSHPLLISDLFSGDWKHNFSYVQTFRNTNLDEVKLKFIEAKPSRDFLISQTRHRNLRFENEEDAMMAKMVCPEIEIYQISDLKKSATMATWNGLLARMKELGL